MNFRVTEGVNSAPVRRFVEGVEAEERALWLEIHGFLP
jgi:hypothetical protein